jgi:hypothetical protein
MRKMRDSIAQEIKNNKILALETTKMWTNDKKLQKYIVSHLGSFGLENFDCDYSSWESVELCVQSLEEELYLLSQDFMD